MNKFPITKEGYLKLEEELRHLKNVERPAISKAIAEARELGDLSENAEYHAARERQSFIEGRIIELEDKFARADVIDLTKLVGSTDIKFGAIVDLIDDDIEQEVKYKIVGEYEADLNNGMISVVSPLARALIGKKVGDYIEVVTPKATKSYEIVAIKYE
jgi:transcription elongation factor GreA